ncbi:hypothetical protein TNCV_4210011 [Trichonephila clavipes]|nr:hypothetical protein TNCV_4210011 [Trichonephila clavipes]
MYVKYVEATSWCGSPPCDSTEVQNPFAFECVGIKKSRSLTVIIPYYKGCSPQNWGETKKNRTVICMVLKATTVNNRRSTSPCPEVFHGS